MIVNKIEIFLLFGIIVALSQTQNNRTSKPTIVSNNIDNDYYYDYELTNNISTKYNKDSDILPNPELFESDFVGDTVDVLPEVNIPDNSLADTDLHDHDFMDNLMYIYYGTHSKDGYTFGVEIILIGSVLSGVAHFLTIICTALRKKPKNDLCKLQLNITVCLTLANLIFMLGVYATKNKEKCIMIAVFLHYVHLLVSVWIFTYSYVILKRFSNEYVPKIKIIMVLSYGIPAFLVVLCYGISPNSYEHMKFCWMSVQKGMFLNFMLPVTALIIATTFISLNGIRKINLELSKYELSSSDSIATTIGSNNNNFEHKTKLVEKSIATYVDVQLNNDESVRTEKSSNEDSYLNCLHACKNCLKMLSIMQTTYVVVWFIAVLALENAMYSFVMPSLYAISSTTLNWYIFLKSKNLFLNLKDIYNIESQMDLNISDVQKSMEETTNLAQCELSDSVPLLNSSDNYTELIELRTESISTISS